MNMSGMKRKTVFVTGSRCRIGEAIALAFADKGWNIVLHSRKSLIEVQSVLEAVRARGGEVGFIQADLKCAESRCGIIAKAKSQFGRLDALVNNASIYQRGDISEFSEEELLYNYEVNFKAPYDLMEQFHQVCGEGGIVNLLDQKIVGGDDGCGWYLKAKKELAEATMQMARKWAPAVRVNGVAPGIVLPPPNASCNGLERMRNKIPLQRITSVDSVAGACVFLVESPDITGQIVFVDGGLHLQPNNLGEPDGRRIYGE